MYYNHYEPTSFLSSHDPPNEPGCLQEMWLVSCSGISLPKEEHVCSSLRTNHASWMVCRSSASISEIHDLLYPGIAGLKASLSILAKAHVSETTR